jgi:spore maturation protein CgeB
MRIIGFYHSLVSDWNHGNAHFLRGVASELIHRGHDVGIFEPAGGWSYGNLVQEYGREPVERFQRRFPHLRSRLYNLNALDLDMELEGADLVLVHEWNEPALVKRIGQHHRRNPNYVLLFHDTHHRAITAPETMSTYDLSGFDGVLAYGDTLHQVYRKRGWAQEVWTWHEAADTRVFKPQPEIDPDTDLVWVGNWGDDERTAELHEYLIGPVRDLRLRARVYGVRYPDQALYSLATSGIDFGGWLPNYEVPQAFARALVTVHIPRRPYVQALPGIPTIRPFEALACGIPLVSSPWEDSEQLFTVGLDFLMAHSGRQMREYVRAILNEPELRHSLSQHGLQTVLSRHTCSHRVDELLSIYAQVCSHGAALAMEHS